MSAQSAVGAVSEWFPEWAVERDKLDRLDQWYRGEQDRPTLPSSATAEMKRLADLSTTPWLGLVVTIVAQCMYVDGIRPTAPVDPAGGLVGPWRTWLMNGMQRHQIALHRAMLAYGQSFATALPGADWQGRPMSVIRGCSPRKMFAAYGEPATDDWPILALHVETQPDKSHLVRLYDEEAVYFLTVEQGGTGVEFVSYDVHNSGVCPVVRYTNMLDLDGRCDGEVAPMIPAAAQIDKTDFDLSLVQHFASWKIRTATGMTKPDSEEEANQKAMELAISDILMAESPEAKFGTLDATPLDGFISARKSNIEKLSAVSQSPTHELTGQMANLSAEALAAARASVNQKVFERKMSSGSSHGQLARLTAHQEGDEVHANDFGMRVTWQDTEVRSLSQAADALGKIAQQLGVPAAALWERIPGVEKTDVDQWRKLAREDDPVARYTAELARQAVDAPPVPPADHG